MRSLIGQQLGDYVLEAELGSGSMGAVYRATYFPQRTTVAIKVLLDELASDVSFITRFIREARVISSLDHPNIVRVYDAGRQGEYIYFVMEYFPGATAGQMLRERQRLPLETVVEIAAQTADALAYAHREGRLVHRDIKPDNLLVNERCRVKVLDFGLARIEGAEALPWRAPLSAVCITSRRSNCSDAPWMAAPMSTRSASPCMRCSPASAPIAARRSPR